MQLQEKEEHRDKSNIGKLTRESSKIVLYYFYIQSHLEHISKKKFHKIKKFQC